MFDGREETRELPQPIIQSLKRDNYRFYIISEILKGMA